jgi:predicted nucleic acid-binding protein
MPIIAAPPETPLVLDTDIFTHLRNRKEYVISNIRNHFSYTKQLPAITAVTVFEAIQGIESAVVKNKLLSEEAILFRQRISTLTSQHKVLHFDQSAAEIAAHIFPRLSQSERNNHWRDLFIASIALANKYGLASQNRKDIELIAKHLPENYKYLRLAVWRP